MAYFDTDELLAAALTQLGREQGDIASEPMELAVGRRGFSSPKADKQWEIDKYFENIRRLREKGILPSPKAEVDDSYLNDEIAFFASPNPGPAPVRPGEVPTDPSSPYAPWKKSPHLAGLVGYEDWTGPKEHGPFPDIFKSRGINQKGLKSLMEEMQEYRRRGVL